MKWSPQQDAALSKVADWLANGERQVFRIFGFAGTGKTTLAKHFAEGVEGRVLFGALTGKAAYVLQLMGCEGAETLHSLIYHAKEKGRAHLKDMEQQLSELRHELLMELGQEDQDDPAVVQANVEEHKRVVEIRRMIEEERSSLARPMFTLNMESALRGAALLVVDEVSMVDGVLGPDLLSFGTKILVLGDPAQLPPVYGAGFFTEGVEPDVMLTEIHRQAAENPIIAMATQVRNQEALRIGSYGESKVIEAVHLDQGEVIGADQVLVGRNATRRTYNRRLRQLKGFTDILPVPGDKLVCLRNNHEKGLLNGAIWHVDAVGPTEPERIYLSLHADVGPDLLDVEAHTCFFRNDPESLGWWERREAEEFDYGDALTVHKAQGSQWDDTVLFDESWCFRADRWKWLYTGLTRGAKRVTVVRL